MGRRRIDKSRCFRGVYSLMRRKEGGRRVGGRAEVGFFERLFWVVLGRVM